eukprot:Skav225761  [mRNA]  locus=scaffold3552:169394:182132:- [translate_table: standard]
MQAARAQGKDYLHCIYSQGGTVMFRELSVAILDEIMMGRTKREEAPGSLCSSPSCFSDEEDSVEPKAKTRPKAHLLPPTWPRARASDDKPMDETKYAEKRLRAIRHRYKMLDSHLGVMLRGMAAARGLEKPDDLRPEVKETLSMLGTILMEFDALLAGNIPQERISAWRNFLELKAHKTSEAPEAPPEIPEAPVVGTETGASASNVAPVSRTSSASGLKDFLGDEDCNEVDLRETRATSTVSRSQSEDSLERELCPPRPPPVRTSLTGVGPAPSVAASLAILRSKPRRVGRSTARLHSWQR